MKTTVEGSAIQYAVQLHDAGEHVPTPIVDAACREMDGACAEGRHCAIRGGRCVWCNRNVERTA